VYVPSKPLQPKLMVVGKALAIIANIRLSWKGLSVRNTLAYYKNTYVTDAKVLQHWTLYYKILRIRNLREIDILQCKQVSLLLSITSTVDLKNTLAYRTLRNGSVFIVQSPDEIVQTFFSLLSLLLGQRQRQDSNPGP
jgi:hypothetical protein